MPLLLLLGARAADGDLDFSFRPALDDLPESHPRSAVIQPDGRIVVAAHGPEGAPRPDVCAIRIHPDGSRDPGFGPADCLPTSSFSVVAMQADGKILIAEDRANRIHRLLPEGTFDPAFKIELSGPLDVVLPQPDGKILIGGIFLSVTGSASGPPVPRNGIARFHADGAVDFDFDPGSGPQTSEGVGVVNDLAVQADGRILVAGYFSEFNGVPRTGLTRLHPDGGVDATFVPGALGGNTQDRIWGADDVAVQADGRILAVVWLAEEGQMLVRIHPDGSRDESFAGLPNYESVAGSFLVQADGRILNAVEWYPLGIDDGGRGQRLFRIAPDGTPDPSFNSPTVSNPLGDGLGIDAVLDADGRLLISGGSGFTRINGTPRPGIAKLLNGEASQHLSVPSSTRVAWFRRGTIPESAQVWFEMSTDAGATWTHLGIGSWNQGAWELSGLNLPAAGLLRARTFARSLSRVSSLLEQTVSFSLPDSTPDFSVEVRDGLMLVTDNTGGGGALLLSEPTPGHIQFHAGPRTFRVNGGPLLSADSGSLPLGTVTRILVRAGDGDDVIEVGEFTHPLPDLLLQGGGGSDAATLRSGGFVTIEDADGFTLNGSSVSKLLTVNSDGPVIQTAPLDGLGGLRKLGRGTLTLSLPNSYLGTTTVSDGTLALVHASPNNLAVSGTIEVETVATLNVRGLANGRLELAPGQTLTGNGALLGRLEIRSDTTLAVGGNPGTPVEGSSGVSQVLQTGAVSIHPGSTFSINFVSLAHGRQSVGLDVRGTVILGEAMLKISTDWDFFSSVYLQSPPYEFTIVRNDGHDPVSGTFAGLPEGAVVPTADAFPTWIPLEAIVSYRGGDGNDVTVTFRQAPPLPLVTGGALDPSFTPGDHGFPAISSAALQPDGRIVVTHAAGTSDTMQYRVARLDSDGSLDDGFTLGAIVPEYRTLGGKITAVLPDGRIIVSATSLQSGRAVHGLARLRPDGTPDPTFRLRLGTPDVAWASDASVDAVVVLPGGKLLIGGCFHTVDGVARNGIARLNPDGSTDTDFSPGAGPGFSGPSSVSGDEIAAIKCLSVQDDGRILVGGYFNQFAGSPRIGIARLNPDGTLDPAFDAKGTLFANDVHSIAIQADGRMLVVGSFWDHPARQDPSSGIHNKLVRLLPDGAPDAGFAPASPPDLDPADEIALLGIQADGRILLGAATFKDGDPPQGGGVTYRIHPDGSRDPGFVSAFDPDFTFRATMQADGKILATAFAGKPFTATSPPPTGGIARLLNGPAALNLSVPNPTRVDWLRGGTTPETSRVWFELSTDEAITWTSLGAGSRVPGGWALDGLKLPQTGKLRSRAIIADPQGRTSSVLEQTVDYSLPGAAPDFDVRITDGTILVTDNTGIGGEFTLSQSLPGRLRFSAPGRTFRISGGPVRPSGSGDLSLSGVVLITTRFGDKSDDIRIESTATDFPEVILQSGGGADTIALLGGSKVTLQDPDGFILNGSSVSSLLVINSDGPVTQAALISGSGALHKLGGGTLILSHDNRYTGETRVESGTLALVNPSLRTTFRDSPVFSLQNGATLDARGLADGGLQLGRPAIFRGYGTVLGTLEIQDGGSLAPGSVPGILDVENLLLQGGATLTVNIEGFQAGTQYHQVRVAGRIRLENAILDLAASWDVDQKDAPVVLLDNRGSHPVEGTFRDLPEGSRIYLRGVNQTPWTLSYHGGDGNDVTLTLKTSDGELNTDFHSDVQEFETVQSAAVQANHAIVLGGIAPTGEEDPHRIARLSPSGLGGRRDPAFATGPLVPGYRDFGGRVTAVQPDGRILISAGEYQFEVDGQPHTASGLARIGPDGSFDPQFRTAPDIHGVGSISSLVLQPDGRILIAGSPVATAVGATAGIARLHPDGSLDGSFAPGAGANGSVLCMTLQDDGRIVIGGIFDSFNGVSRNRMARLHPDGSLDAGFMPADALDLEVSAVALQADGNVLAAGASRGALDPTASDYRIVRFLPDGSLDTGFLPWMSRQARTSGLVVQADGRVVVTTTPAPPITGAHPDAVFRLLADGTRDPDFTPASSVGAVWSVVPQPHGNLLITGNFTEFNGAPRAGIVELLNRPGTRRLEAADSTRLVWMRDGSLPEVAYVGFEMSTDQRQTWTRLGAGTRIRGGWELGGLSLPQSFWIRARACIISTSADASSSSILEELGVHPRGSADFRVAMGESSLDILGGNVTPNGGPFTVSEPAPGFIEFSAPGRRFQLGLDTFYREGSSGPLPLASITAIHLGLGSGPDAVDIGRFTGALPKLRLDGGGGSDVVSVASGSVVHLHNAGTWTLQGSSVSTLLSVGAAGPVVQTAPLTGTAALHYVGSRTFTLSEENTYQGETLVEGGTLALVHASHNNLRSSPLLDLLTREAILDVSGLADGRFDLSPGQTLRGEGTVRGDLRVLPGATVAPGRRPRYPGFLVLNHVEFEAGSTLSVWLYGRSLSEMLADGIRVAGTVKLAGATLHLPEDLPLSPTPSQDGDTFLILDNDEGDPVLGTFAGLPEGTTIPFRSRHLRISYSGGDGNDVTLTVVSPPPPGTLLADFSAEAWAAGVVRLTWETLKETAVLGFHLDRAIPSGGWDRLTMAYIEALGAGDEPRFYEFTDTAPGAVGGARYRLMEVGLQGEERELATASVPPSMTTALPPGGVTLQILIQGAPAENVLLESATALPGPWVTLQTIVLDASGRALLIVDRAGETTARFYRVFAE
ncbi:MAG: autotransporter-associated beta strand repeat-containing protein [Verrucomicrobiae bacterium]|nr:autotransporter-associated beta strand repeat-containing protein [Verrucomicrobiae bacterium]